MDDDEILTITITDDALREVRNKFETELESSEVETMIRRFPAGLAGIRSRYQYIEPRFVAIGPYHHGKEHLVKMEEVKKAASKYFCDLTNLVPEEMNLVPEPEELNLVPEPEEMTKKKKEFWKAVEEARGRYVDFKEEGTKDGGHHASFADMMFCDACFLLLYMDAYSRSFGDKEDNVVDRSIRRFLFCNRDSINNDIMLLENQLPWPVLQALMDLVSSKYRGVLMEGVGNFIACMGNTFKVLESRDPETYDWYDAKNPPPHLLALLRRHKTELGRQESSNYLSPPNDERPLLLNNCLNTKKKKRTRGPPNNNINTPPQTEQQKEDIPKFNSISAVSPMELEDIGIKLTASKTAAFSNMGLVERRPFSELSLAPLYLSESAASCLVNMAAFEVCTASRFGDDPSKSAVCSYLALLDMFMVREEDVQTLRSKGLLHGNQRDKDMLIFFKTVMKHLPDKGPRFVSIMEDIRRYKDERHIWIPLYKWSRRNYASILSVVSIIKVLSFLGTLIGLYEAVLSIKKQN